MKKYPAYKDSEIQWIGEIPEQWGIKKLKFLFRIVNGATPKTDNAEFWDGDIAWITPSDLGKLNDKFIYSSERMISETGLKNCSASIAPINSIILSTRAPIGHVGLLKISATTNQGCKTLILIDEKTNSIFAYYVLLAAKEILQSIGSGSTFTELSTQSLKNFEIVFPEFPVQTAIATFLEQKTSEIDRLIATKTELIQKLEAERKTIINEAVTGLAYKTGLIPIPEGKDLRFKDSGIEYIGEISEHWEVLKLKYLLESPLQYGANESAELDDPNLPRYIRITDFGDNGQLREETFKSLTLEKADGYYLNSGDILFARSGATVGKTFQFKNYEGRACFAGYLIRAAVNELRMKSDFLYLYTKSHHYQSWKNSIFSQATIQNIGADKYKDLTVTVPPLSEQIKITEFLKQKTEEIDCIVSEATNSIIKLKQYKQSLILEAVTGKIDVREWQKDELNLNFRNKSL